MARLLSVTESKLGGMTHSAPIAKAYGVNKVKAFRVEGADDTSFELDERGAKKLRVVTETYAAMKTAINTADTVVGAQSIEANVKRIIGKSEDDATGYLKSFPTDDIVEIYPDPDDATDSIIRISEGAKLEDTLYVVDETVAALIALANI